MGGGRVMEMREIKKGRRGGKRGEGGREKK